MGLGRNFEHPLLNTQESSVQYSVPLLSWGTFRCPPRAPAPWGEGRSRQSGPLRPNKNQLLLFAGVFIANGLCKNPGGWVGLHCAGSTCLGADAGLVSAAAFSPRRAQTLLPAAPGGLSSDLESNYQAFLGPEDTFLSPSPQYSLLSEIYTPIIKMKISN